MIYEEEVILTDDDRLLEVGEDKDVESLEKYQQELAEERGDDSGVGALDYEYGYLTNGTLRVHAPSSCNYAAVDYFKDGGSTITAQFGARWNNKDKRGSTQSIAPGGRGGDVFYTSSSTPKSFQGIMWVNGNDFRTEFAAC
ncbi:hypothetical protein [Streptomonospora alba]|uniref:hypothetical protein n=1 Tax=Streptomonospora alba TaxID=183763 RepID=UPI0012ED6381|nr:hypothetical protein [Streptomonospora alba]